MRGEYLLETSSGGVQATVLDSYVHYNESHCTDPAVGLTIDRCFNSTISGGEHLANIDNTNAYFTINAKNSELRGKIFANQRSRNSFCLNLKDCDLKATLETGESHIDILNGPLYMENCRIETTGVDDGHTVITANRNVFWTGVVENTGFANSVLVDAPSAIDLNYNLSVGPAGELPGLTL